MKIRFIEPSNRPYRRSIKNLYVYDRYIRTPSVGLLTLTTIVQEQYPDTLMYSESISKIEWRDVLDADVVFIGIFTFQAMRGYEIAAYIHNHSEAAVVLGGLHATAHYQEACRYADFVLLGEGDETILAFLKAWESKGEMRMKGIAYQKDGVIRSTGKAEPPAKFETIPNRTLLYRYAKMAGHNTVWPQVHASRGCPHNCDYCAVVRHFGHAVRTRSPENVLADIRDAIAFHDEKHHRLAKMLWLTDDNFFADRGWAISVLRVIIDSGIHYHFTVQARYEVGFDDEVLILLKQAGFDELAMGIEFTDDQSFELYHKRSTCSDIVASIENIQRHGLRVRGLFIVGSDVDTKGIGDKLADFVIKHDIAGVLIQSMYFVPGTPAYETHKDRLLHQDWSKYAGNVVHRPERITPYDLQCEMIRASAKIYSKKRLLRAIFKKRGLERLLFVGEYFWQKSTRQLLRQELSALEK